MVYHLILPIQFSLLLPPVIISITLHFAVNTSLRAPQTSFQRLHVICQGWVVLSFRSWVNHKCIVTQATGSDSFWLRCTRNTGKTHLGEVTLQEHVPAYSLQRFLYIPSMNEAEIINTLV